MKKSILVIVSIFIALNTMAADQKYYQEMGAALGEMSKCSSLSEYQEVANQFSTIANVETTEWLPLYYEAQCYILMSFMENEGPEAKDAWLDQADISIRKMLEMAPGESEVFALKAFYHTGRLVVNPPERSQTTAPLVEAAISKSLKLDSKNPRAKFMRLSNAIGTARFFGSDISVYCEDANELLEDWDSFVINSPIHPQWGKSQVEEIVNSCTK